MDPFFDQTVVPPSFVALHQDARGRLGVPRTELVARHELCEDLAQMLTERAGVAVHGAGLSEDVVLERVRAGLDAALADAGLSEPEADWVVKRLAELMGWWKPTAPDAR